MKYAGIGSRQTPADIILIMQYSAQILARKKYTCCTGACQGADQAFGNGAINANGKLNLFVPWYSYEGEWIKKLIGDVNITAIDLNKDILAVQSVYEFHPAANKLKPSVMKLHARNYLIVDGVDFIICWTPNGEITGGTGQALRIAAKQNITVYNLGNPETLENFKIKLREEGYSV